MRFLVVEIPHGSARPILYSQPFSVLVKSILQRNATAGYGQHHGRVIMAEDDTEPSPGVSLYRAGVDGHVVLWKVGQPLI